MDDLKKFHEKNTAGDPQYATARQLLDLGEAVARLRKAAGLTRSELGKELQVQTRDIAVLEEDTPRTPAGLLEEALTVLVRGVTPNMQHESEVWLSIQRIRQLRPTLLPVHLSASCLVG
jgi:transcriptional regulator with XRE-family HTH domain